MGYSRSDFELAELAGRVGNIYVRAGLSPPFALRDAERSPLWSPTI
jgi:hypothetical protein